MKVRDEVMARIKSIEHVLYVISPSLENPSMIQEDCDMIRNQVTLVIKELADIRGDIKQGLKESD